MAPTYPPYLSTHPPTVHVPHQWSCDFNVALHHSFATSFIPQAFNATYLNCPNCPQTTNTCLAEQLLKSVSPKGKGKSHNGNRCRMQSNYSRVLSNRRDN